MQTVEFSKMSGCGNDFIIVDNRIAVVDEQDLERFIIAVCRRKQSVGADGLVLVENSADYDFQWRFFNSDGSRGEMCGNAARCAARYAHMKGIAGAEMVFGTDVGPVKARLNGHGVKLKMPRPKDLSLDEPLPLDQGTLQVNRINTGVPHVVVPVKDPDEVDVIALGRAIRNHAAFAPGGTNVNFVSPLKNRTMRIRTYERGVEDETLACGTGAVAAALVTACKENLAGPLNLCTRGRKTLRIYFERQGEQFEDVYLEGEARMIYQGRLNAEAWD